MDLFLTYIVPVFNGEKYLEATLRSISSQAGAFELIVVDDGSTDSSSAIARVLLGEIESMGMPGELITQENQGEASAVNAGIERAKGKYLCVVSADDIVPKNHCLLAMSSATTDVVLMVPNVNTIDSEGRIIRQHIPLNLATIRHRTLERAECVPSVGSIVRTAEAKATLRRPYTHLSDFDFYFRLLEGQDAWGGIIALPEAVCSWRLHSGNLTNRAIESKRANYIHFAETLREMGFLTAREIAAARSAALIQGHLLSLEDGRTNLGLLLGALFADPMNSIRFCLERPVPVLLAAIGYQPRR